MYSPLNGVTHIPNIKITTLLLFLEFLLCKEETNSSLGHLYWHSFHGLFFNFSISQPSPPFCNAFAPPPPTYKISERFLLNLHLNRIHSHTPVVNDILLLANGFFFSNTRRPSFSKEPLLGCGEEKGYFFCVAFSNSSDTQSWSQTEPPSACLCFFCA